MDINSTRKIARLAGYGILGTLAVSLIAKKDWRGLGLLGLYGVIYAVVGAIHKVTHGYSRLAGAAPTPIGGLAEDLDSKVLTAPGNAADWTGLAADCGLLMDELDRKRLELNEDSAAIAGLAYSRIEQLLTDNGAETFTDSSFDIARHIAAPPRRVPQGTPIVETITPGLCIGSRILRRARVRVELR